MELQINLLEEFISNNRCLSEPAISNGDLINGKQIYKEILDKSTPHYECFGSDALGYISYGLYKSIDKKVVKQFNYSTSYPSIVDSNASNVKNKTFMEDDENNSFNNYIALPWFFKQTGDDFNGL
jgi:hypothetical protein